MDLVHLPLLWLVTSWLSLQHFQSCHLIVDSVVRTFGGQNARWINFFNSPEANCGPLSEYRVSGMPWRAN